MFEKNMVYDRAALLEAFGLKPVELPRGWELTKDNEAVPPSKRLRREFLRATGRELEDD
jgi:hypothetical protein